MSLQVDDRWHRDRSRSPGRRGDDGDRSRGRAPEPNIIDAVRMPSPPAGFSYNYDDPRSSYGHDSRQALYRVTSPAQESYYRGSHEHVDEYAKYSMPGGYREDSDRDRDRDSDKNPLASALSSGAAAFLPAKYAAKVEKAVSRDSSSDKERKKREKKERLEEDLAYGSTASIQPPLPPRPEERPTSGYGYANAPKWEYDKPDEKHTYSIRNEYTSRPLSPANVGRYQGGLSYEPGRPRASSASKKYTPEPYGADPRTSGANVLTVEPGRNGRDRSRSPRPPHQRMASLSVNTGFAAGATMSLANTPGSPLLEAYHGTYQSMSPMPSPLLLASEGPGAFPAEPLSPVVSDDERGDKVRRRARFHDPEEDALRIAKALRGEKHGPDTRPLIEILPGMTHEQIMELRTEYKRQVKTGAEKKGVNVAKHIRARLKDEDPLLMKACYATALGKWESEAYWANFWYQGDKTRRELLIESIMGRSNYDIRNIKDGFNDKKYHNSLTQCMKTELKEDKFKKAVLMVLEERRMEEVDEYGRPLPIDRGLVDEDVYNLYKAVRSEKGGETLMISIVVMRSDTHLRHVLSQYEKSYKSNFARDALKKSTNLVGELLAHILNGVINKPVRDALLLNHALTASKKDNLRRELLISRLVRFHWDRHHMAAVKKAYRSRYRVDLSDAIRESTSGEWGLFCRELCVARIPDHVKKFSKVEIINVDHR